MTIQEFQNIAKKEINRTMEGLMAMVEQIDVSALPKQKKQKKTLKSCR